MVNNNKDLEKISEIKKRIVEYAWVELSYQEAEFDLPIDKEFLYSNLDDFSEQFGYKRIGKTWIEINEEQAKLLAKKLLSVSLAYGNFSDPISEEAETDIEELVGIFLKPVRYFTNSTFYKGDENSWSSSPLTSSTFDTGILAWSKNIQLILCVRDED